MSGYSDECIMPRACSPRYPRSVPKQNVVRVALGAPQAFAARALGVAASNALSGRTTAAGRVERSLIALW